VSEARAPDPAGEFADPDGLGVVALPVGLALTELVPAELAPAEPVPAEPVPAEPVLATELADGGRDVAAALVVAVGPLAGDEDGPNVATDSIAPATRHTASTLAIRGITVPRPPNGAVSRFSRSRRRRARCSRWYASTSRASSRASSGIWMSSGGSSRPDPPPGFTGHLPARIGPFPSKYHPAKGLRIPGPPRGLQ
jgi:hypothetical protein